METEKSTKQSMWSQWSSPPNLVTLARIVLVVVFLGLYIGGGAWGARNIGMRWGAAIVFIIAAGFLAWGALHLYRRLDRVR